MIGIKLLVWVFLFSVPPSISLAQSKKIPVAVTQTGNDYVGQGIAFSLKEAIRSSQGFLLVDDQGPKARIAIRITSVESYAPERAVSSAVATVIVYDSVDVPGSGILMNWTVQSCGREKTDFCAKRLLILVDKEIEQLRMNWPDLWKNL